MPESLDSVDVKRVIGLGVSEAEAEALARWYANLARGVARFPMTDLKEVEPPLRSSPGPRAS